MTKKYYIYKTTNIINNKIYIGKHSSANMELDSYFGSGIYINKAIKKYGKSNFKREILYQFDNEEDAYLMESKIVNEDFIKRSDTYNVQCGGTGSKGQSFVGKVVAKNLDGDIVHINKQVFDEHRELYVGHTKGKTVVKDEHDKISVVDVMDDRLLSGNLMGITKGYTAVKDINGICFNILKTDPRLKTGEVVGVRSGYISCKDKDGNLLSVLKDDQRWVSGQLVGVNFGRKLNIQHPCLETGTCPHCGKSCGIRNLKRWHLDNCKQKKDN